MTAADPRKVVKQISDLLFFDNLALHYLSENVPPRVLARVFICTDARISGSVLGILSVKQREIVHALMVQEDDKDELKNQQACDGLCIIADGLIMRGLITKQGRNFFGVPSDQDLKPGS